MLTVAAGQRITTRRRPTGQVQTCPADEVLTTHAAKCPDCSRETLVAAGVEGIVYGSCAHFRGVNQIAEQIEILFEVAQQ